MQTSSRASPSAKGQRREELPPDTAETAWKPLYHVGGAVAVSIAIIFLIELIGVVATGLPPTTVLGWFTLLHHDRLRGLFDLFLLDSVAVLLSGLLYLALYAALRRASPASMTIATACAFVGITVYLASNTSLTLLSLSDQYAAATTDAERATLLAAGQASMAGITSTAAPSLGIFLGFTLPAIAGLLVSIVMLRSTVFGKGTAWVGILGNALQLGPPGQFVPASWSSLLVVLIGLGGALLIIWYVLLARRLFQLGRTVSRAATKLPEVAETSGVAAGAAGEPHQG